VSGSGTRSAAHASRHPRSGCCPADSRQRVRSWSRCLGVVHAQQRCRNAHDRGPAGREGRPARIVNFDVRTLAPYSRMCDNGDREVAYAYGSDARACLRRGRRGRRGRRSRRIGRRRASTSPTVASPSSASHDRSRADVGSARDRWSSSASWPARVEIGARRAQPCRCASMKYRALSTSREISVNRSSVVGSPSCAARSIA